MNASRTEAYASHAGLGWFRAAYRNDDLVSILGDGRYDSPLQDDAPWVDTDDPDTFDFYGAYPLDVTGVENSTATASVVESVSDGGVVTRSRRGTRTVVFSTVLVGKTEAAVEAGMRWLKVALAGGPCVGRSDESCGGLSLCYLASDPCVDWANCVGDPTECLAPLQRNLRKVAAITGPVVTGKSTMSNGEGTAWGVTFTLVAGNPYEFGSETRLVDGFMNPAVSVPYYGGVVPEGASFDADGFVQQDPDCPVLAYEPIFDPLCPAVIPPPDPPNVAIRQAQGVSCFNFPVNYRRRQFTIPEQYVPLWGDVVPLVEIKTHAFEVRSLRLRFYADVLGTGDPNDDPCAYCGDIVFAYIPARSTMVFDGSDRQVYVRQGTIRRRADSLAIGSDGAPFTWPELTCGHGYVVTIDLPQTQEPPVVDLTLMARVS